jgi:hypothetical protein
VEELKIIASNQEYTAKVEGFLDWLEAQEEVEG